MNKRCNYCGEDTHYRHCKQCGRVLEGNNVCGKDCLNPAPVEVKPEEKSVFNLELNLEDFVKKDVDTEPSVVPADPWEQWSYT